MVACKSCGPRSCKAKRENGNVNFVRRVLISYSSVYSCVVSYRELFLVGMYPSKSVNYQQSSTAYQTDSSGTATQEQQQYHNYYYQQKGSYYYPPPPAEPAPGSCPPPPSGPPPPDAKVNDEHSAMSSQSNESDPNNHQRRPSPAGTPGSENSGGSGISLSAGEVQNSDSSNTSSNASLQVQNNPTYDPGNHNAQGQDYQGYNQQTTTATSSEPYNPEAPTNDYTNWNQQQQETQQWQAQGWTWNPYLGKWEENPGWTQQQQQQVQGHQQVGTQVGTQVQGVANQQQQQQQQPQQQPQQQWSGVGWSQWPGQVAGGQWGLQQPGAEAWVGQHYQAAAGYQQTYNYPSYYSGQVQQPQHYQQSQQQQQQQQQHYQQQYQQQYQQPGGNSYSTYYGSGTNVTPAAPSRSKSPGTPPLPELQAKNVHGRATTPVQQTPVNTERGQDHHGDSSAASGTKRSHSDRRTEGGRVKKSRWSDRKENVVTPGSQSHSYPPPSHGHTPSKRPAILPTPSTPSHGGHHTPSKEPAGNARGSHHQHEKSMVTPSSRDHMPPKMKEYVTKAFASATNEEERELIHRHLDLKLNKIFAENKQWSIEWDKYPMPLEEINQKLPSRWDTPSPNADATKRGRKSTPQPSSNSRRRSHHNEESDGEGDWGSHGRGRGRKRKKFRNFNKKKGKRFFIDNQPSMELEAGLETTEDDKAKITQRINRFGKQGKSEGNKNFKKKISIDDMLKTVVSSNADDQIYWQDSSVEGTSESLEKAYLRLTSAPDPSMVRPVRVLKLSLRHVCDKWKANRDYHYTCEQFKSMRQDLTIQGVRDKFAIEVYETHARIALENNDREEFNQCQTQLMALYKEKDSGVHQNQAEFTAYRILYQIFTKSTADMSAILKELTCELKAVACVKHALGVCSAWLSGNYYQFFRLYRTAPYMCGALVNMFIERERKVALRSITKAYRPSLPISYISNILGFVDDAECLDFLVSTEAVLLDGNAAIDCKLTYSKLTVPSN